MENNELNALIDAFVGYREMLAPIQNELHEFLNTYSALKEDVQKLDSAFSGDAREKLSEIYKMLASQAEKSQALTNKVDQFLQSTNMYTEKLDHLTETFEGIEGRLIAINSLEERAEKQIERLDSAIEEKKRNYNLKELEKSLDAYNANLQTVGDFINKEVAGKIVENSKSITQIKEGNESVAKLLQDEKKSVESLSETFMASNELLKKIVEKQDVNEAYIFDILDRWAAERGVKTKK